MIWQVYLVMYRRIYICHKKNSTCIAEWRRDYTEVRPHNSLSRIPPAQFAQQHRINSNAAANTNQQVLE
jgi:Integrase core domain